MSALPFRAKGRSVRRAVRDGSAGRAALQPGWLSVALGRRSPGTKTRPTRSPLAIARAASPYLSSLWGIQSMNYQFPANSINAEHSASARLIEAQSAGFGADIGRAGRGEALSPAWLYADDGRDAAPLGPRGELRFFRGVMFVAPGCLLMWVGIYALIRWLA
ncbi:hypothetical protein [Sphingomonas nostoxanthinifaciens]|uniref:hypothetical protein n=1 Tax=Sphingomonas nostoxanthinifaciens TaxID=2872652 RepID=UPI001CC1F9E9|nr:hypothetical protein [Sphingomonas nostoxanthinifaciens]UAK22996.1 hypothetical protein K8P63_11185 [Sphingomonas nostoxanthinifaciens]